MSYRILRVFQGGPRDGCTELANPDSVVSGGYQIHTIVNPATERDVEVRVYRPWSVKDPAPSYL